MLDTLERELHLTIDEVDAAKIIGIFELAKAIQLPVLAEGQVVGILDLFTFLKHGQEKPVHLGELMERDIVIAGNQRSVFTFKNSKQQILPFVDEDGQYRGFINRLFQKCYLPSKEYMQVVEEGIKKGLCEKVTEEDAMDYDGLQEHFDLLFESNYDGIYITVDKGATLSINDRCLLWKGITFDDISGEETGDGANWQQADQKEEQATVVQNIQKRKEISLPENLVSEGGILRVISSPDDLIQIKEELLKTRSLVEKYENELEMLRSQVTMTKDFIAYSPAMKKITNLALKVADVDSTVLLQGQSGSGKGVLSQFIHNNSRRRDQPFMKIDCGSIPENLLESELFGYEKGAFTGAEKSGKLGLIQLANKGTLFLDEIGEMPLNLQMKLLRVIQDKEIVRVGGKEAIPVDIRIIAATNRDLEEMVDQKTFRKDLYYRLNVVPVTIPPLCERREDVRPLIQKNLQEFNEKYGLTKKIEPAALKCLLDYPWPGNVRELENVVEYLAVTASGDVIRVTDLPEGIQGLGSASQTWELYTGEKSLKDLLQATEEAALLEVAKKSKNMKEMARKLKIDRSTVVRKLQKYGIKPGYRVGE